MVLAFVLFFTGKQRMIAESGKRRTDETDVDYLMSLIKLGRYDKKTFDEFNLNGVDFH